MILEFYELLSRCSEGFSPDRVLTDPRLNEKFIAACRANGRRDSTRSLNLQLLNARKAGKLRGLRTTNRTLLGNAENYKFASEIAARFVEIKHNTTLDMILCDPELAHEFDEKAAEIAPGFTPLQYRWAALNLRKSRNLQPENVARILCVDRVELGAVKSLNSDSIPREPGVYVFYTSDQTLYVGESSNLHQRVMKHLDHSDNKLLARWFWDHGQDDVHLEIHVLGASSKTKERRALESELIRSRRAAFNIQRP